MPSNPAHPSKPTAEPYIAWVCCDCGEVNSWPTNPQCMNIYCPTQHVFRKKGCCKWEKHYPREGSYPAPKKA